MQCEQMKIEHEKKAQACNSRLRDHSQQIERLYKGPLSQSDLNYIINNDKSAGLRPKDQRPMSFTQRI
jgi:hypothetical protein